MEDYRKSIKKAGRSIRAQMKRLLLIAGVLFLLLCLFIIVSMRQIFLENANEHTTITAQRLENQLDLMYEKMDIFTMGIAKEDEVQQLMAERFPLKTQYVSSVEEMIAYYKILDSNIMDISLVNEEVHYSTVYSYEELDELQELCGDELFSWLGIRKSRFANSVQKEPMLLYGRKIMSQGEQVGTLIISIDASLFQISSEEELNSYYLLADENGVFYSFNSSEDIANQIWQAWMKISDKAEENAIKGNTWYLQSTFSENMGCYQISALDIERVNSRLGLATRLVWSCMILMVGFMVIIFWMVNKEIVRPLHDFNGVIRKIRTQNIRNLEESLKLGGCYEIQEISEDFSGMLQNIERLNRKIFDTATDLYEMKVQKQEAELSYMRSQIDPHFLYNTLEVFRKMALIKDSPEMAQMAVDMGSIFRYSTKGDSFVPLADEIAIIKSYIRIQKTRFQGKIEVFYSLPPETLKVSVMKMILQPIVENAIYHGLEPKVGKGNLFIGARVEKGTLVITVKDDGVGISEEMLEEILWSLKQQTYDTSKHVGIINTQARIQLQYGTEYGVSLESKFGDGTTVTISVPAKTGGE